MGIRGWSVAVLAVLGGLWLASGTQKEKPVVVAEKADDLVMLEGDVAAHPEDGTRLEKLALAYLGAHAPGLAVGVIQGAPHDVRSQPKVKHVYARALVEQGRNKDALTAEQEVVTVCAYLDTCDKWLLASARRRIEILEELVRLGVDDSQAYPEVSAVAYHSATREAQILLQ